MQIIVIMAGHRVEWILSNDMGRISAAAVYLYSSVERMAFASNRIVQT